MERYNTINEFYWHYEKLKNTTLDDIDQLIKRLQNIGYSVKEYKNGSVVVRSPDELKTAKSRRLKQQIEEAHKYTKLGAAIPVPVVKAFSDACRKLGVSQSEVLLPLLQSTIERTNQISDSGVDPI